MKEAASFEPPLLQNYFEEVSIEKKLKEMKTTWGDIIYLLSINYKSPEHQRLEYQLQVIRYLCEIKSRFEKLCTVNKQQLFELIEGLSKNLNDFIMEKEESERIRKRNIQKKLTTLKKHLDTINDDQEEVVCRWIEDSKKQVFTQLQNDHFKFIDLVKIKMIQWGKKIYDKCTFTGLDKEEICAKQEEELKKFQDNVRQCVLPSKDPLAEFIALTQKPIVKDLLLSFGAVREPLESIIKLKDDLTISDSLENQLLHYLMSIQRDNSKLISRNDTAFIQQLLELIDLFDYRIKSLKEFFGGIIQSKKTAKESISTLQKKVATKKQSTDQKRVTFQSSIKQSSIEEDDAIEELIRQSTHESFTIYEVPLEQQSVENGYKDLSEQLCNKEKHGYLDLQIETIKDTLDKTPKKRLKPWELSVDHVLTPESLDISHSKAESKKHRPELEIEPFLFDSNETQETQNDIYCLEMETSKEQLSYLYEEKSVENFTSSHEYTARDISRLMLNLLGEMSEMESKESFLLDSTVLDTEENYVIRCNTTYILPPISFAGELLLDMISRFFMHEKVSVYIPSIIIIPYNPGFHWVTLCINVSETGDILINYIDSLINEIELINVWHMERVNQFLDQLITKLKNQITFFSNQRLEHTYSTARIQNDVISCGVMTVENISNIFCNQPLLIDYRLTADEIEAIRTKHGEILHRNGFEFDL